MPKELTLSSGRDPILQLDRKCDRCYEFAVAMTLGISSRYGDKARAAGGRRVLGARPLTRGDPTRRPRLAREKRPDDDPAYIIRRRQVLPSTHVNLFFEASPLMAWDEKFLDHKIFPLE